MEPRIVGVRVYVETPPLSSVSLQNVGKITHTFPSGNSVSTTGVVWDSSSGVGVGHRTGGPTHYGIPEPTFGIVFYTGDSVERKDDWRTTPLLDLDVFVTATSVNLHARTMASTWTSHRELGLLDVPTYTSRLDTLIPVGPHSRRFGSCRRSSPRSPKNTAVQTRHVVTSETQSHVESPFRSFRVSWRLGHPTPPSPLSRNLSLVD